MTPALPIPPLLEVHNKIDLWREAHGQEYLAPPQVFSLSAVTGEGCDALLEAIEAHLTEHLLERHQFRLAHGEGKALAWLYAHGQVTHVEEEEDVFNVTVHLSAANAARFKRLHKEMLVV